MKLQQTDHYYYCSESNYYVSGEGGKNYGRQEYETWEDFKEDWIDDIDYNLCFRYDIQEIASPITNKTDHYELWLYFILQRKGNFVPLWIKSIKEENMQEIKEFLKSHWEYMKHQWKEIAE